jgi:hypothetical protein
MIGVGTTDYSEPQLSATELKIEDWKSIAGQYRSRYRYELGV